ncbi:MULTISPECIES: 3-dehydroquinate synthase [Caproicibacterium]|jgi:3-dehydroquinate synthase|uniref:3-dehydroquinate synthase n=1 Tax=Caproicibacterium lactatifermentans TaxID=2666138 RepID=A0A859DR93_9FIRM|nr:3-dehydroquinate synthase [Caproicibacterium lactatifermentans]ARP50970.1 3-dehydroquinate synthase [Ruminococcaceae bacterium CPB6]QKN23302.1 3-dehydroquinate synthase [Caproicibacterium lactatifermentans]QKO30017.1 3-dehydroquinate synthase [Caproicibacterium lactatifermentans]
MTITVHTNPSYDILIENNCIRQIGPYATTLLPAAKRCVVVADTHTAPLYADTVLRSLQTAGILASLVTFPAGEQSKNLSTISRLYAAFSQSNLTRSDFAVALGGGVCGDMTGFAAATWLRGIPFIQIPTSLLAQVDSSVGGKTGVDLPEGKNLVGAFHQPSLVLIDPHTLSSLPTAFFSDGMGEVIKYGCIRSRALFERLETEDCRKYLPEVIAACVDIKRQVVEKDERDTGERAILNFGHTFGHALETLQNYHGLTHGAAVGVGMVLITRMSEQNGMTAPGTANRIAALLHRYGLPSVCTESMQDLISATAHDKKSTGNSVKLILLKDIGHCCIQKVPRADLPRLCREMQ